MVGRVRNRSTVHPGGTMYRPYTGVYTPTALTVSEQCADVIGNRYGENPFLLTRSSNRGWQVFGKSHTSPSFLTEYNGCYSGTNPPPVAPTSSPMSDDNALQYARARQNINRPITDLPVFIKELSDIPMMIKSAGETAFFLYKQLYRKKWDDIYEIPFQVSNAFLNYQFGIRPIVKDLWNMIDFQTTVSKKLKQLDRLYRGSGEAVGFNTTVWNDVAYTQDIAYPTGVYQESFRWQFERYTQRRRWVCLKWQPLNEPPQTDDQKLALAVRLAYGQDVSFATVWGAMPWSWMVDWFTNVGNYLESTRNTVPVRATNSCIMQSTVTRRRSIGAYMVSNPPGKVVVPRLCDNVELKRELIAPGIGNGLLRDLPFLNGSQLSILGALIGSRVGRQYVQ